MKTCNTCRCEKPESEFPPAIRRSGRCKACLAEFNHGYYLRNKEKIAANSREYIRNHPEMYRKAALGYYYRNKDKCREWNRRWIKRNLKYLSEKMNLKYRTDIQHALRMRFRSRIHSALKRRNASLKKLKPTMELIGCDRETMFRHIESLFKDGMSWENRGKWHIDHVVPLAKFDLTIESERLLAFNYKNTQPLWASENHAKGCRV